MRIYSKLLSIRFPSLLILLLFLGCNTSTQNSTQENISSFYVGTYNTDDSKGIYKYQLMPDGSLHNTGLATVSDNPSFLAMSEDKKFLLATNENNLAGTGTVESFLIQGDSLIFISQKPSGGGHPCFITVNDTGYVLVANYTGGNVGLLRLDNNGKLSDMLDVQQHVGMGTTDRQQSPHAHSTWFSPSDNGVISVDLGTNELWFSSIDTVLLKFIPSKPYKLKMEPGAGPRHLVFHPDGSRIYVVNELDCTITLLDKNDSGFYEKISSASTLPSAYTEPNTCADIHISSDGKFLYASNRGHNSIAIFKVNSKNGHLSLLGHQSTHGSWPRNFALSPDENYLLVANQYTNNIVSFKRDKTSGLLQYVSEIETPAPVCILF